MERRAGQPNDRNSSVEDIYGAKSQADIVEQKMRERESRTSGIII